MRAAFRKLSLARAALPLAAPPASAIPLRSAPQDSRALLLLGRSLATTRSPKDSNSNDNNRDRSNNNNNNNNSNKVHKNSQQTQAKYKHKQRTKGARNDRSLPLHGKNFNAGQNKGRGKNQRDQQNQQSRQGGNNFGNSANNYNKNFNRNQVDNTVAAAVLNNNNNYSNSTSEESFGGYNDNDMQQQQDYVRKGNKRQCVQEQNEGKGKKSETNRLQLEEENRKANVPPDGKSLSQYTDVESYMRPVKYSRLVNLLNGNEENVALGKEILLTMEHQMLQRSQDVEVFGRWFKANRDQVMKEPKFRAGIVRLLTLDSRDDLMEEFLSSGLLLSTNKKFPADESTWSNVVTWLGGKGDIDRSLEYLQKMRENDVQIRTRTYTGLLKYLTENAATTKDLEILDIVLEGLRKAFAETKQSGSEEPEEEHFVMCLKAAIRIAETAKSKDDGTLAGNALDLFNKIVDHSFDLIRRPSLAFQELIRKRCQLEGEWKITDDAQIDSEARTCTACGSKLVTSEYFDKHLPRFTKELHDLLFRTVQGTKTASGQQMVQTYMDNLDNLEGKVDVILDAANIAYYKQNFQDGGWSFPQLLQIIDELDPKMHKLIIMHVLHRKSDTRDPINKAAYDALMKRTDCTMQLVYNGNDDLYWAYAALRLGVPFVSNDFMRDHFYSIFSDSTFLEWKEQHQIFFHAFRDDRFNCKGISLKWPPKVALRAQRAQDSYHFMELKDSTQDNAPEADLLFPESDPLLLTQRSVDGFSWTCFHSKASKSEEPAKVATSPKKETQAATSSPKDVANDEVKNT